MNNFAVVFDHKQTETSPLVDVLQHLDYSYSYVKSISSLQNALSNKMADVIFVQKDSIDDFTIADILLLNEYKKGNPLILVFDHKSIEDQIKNELIKQGVDGFFDLSAELESNSKYIFSLLRIKEKSQSNVVNSNIFQLLFQTMFSAYALHEIIVDEDEKPINYRYLEVNPAFERITGFKAGEVVGKTLLDLFPDANPQVIEKYGEVALNNEKLQFEQFSEEHKKYFEIIAFSPRRGQFSTIFTDVTDYKEAIELVKKSEAQLKELNETKDKFFSIVAHDLKNPFHHILGFVDVLHEDYSEYSEDEKREIIDQIKKSTESAYNLLINLLEWSRMQLDRIEVKPEMIDLHKLVEVEIENQNSRAQAKEVSITNEIDDELFAFADMNMLCTVIRNLISNAIKFTAKGGKISIIGSAMPKFTTLCIADDGVGIDEDRLNSLFKLKTNQSTLGTDKEKGTGLGLNLCKEFVEQNNGKIWAESQLGIGSRFNILLPNQEETT